MTFFLFESRSGEIFPFVLLANSVEAIIKCSETKPNSFHWQYCTGKIFLQQSPEDEGRRIKQTKNFSQCAPSLFPVSTPQTFVLCFPSRFSLGAPVFLSHQNRILDSLSFQKIFSNAEKLVTSSQEHPIVFLRPVEGENRSSLRTLDITFAPHC